MKRLNSFEENIHSLVIFIIVFIFAIFVFLTNNYYKYILIYFICMGILYFQKTSLKVILETVVISFIFSFFCAYFIVIFPHAKYANTEMITWKMLNVPKALVVNQFKVFLQVGLVSSVSFLSMRLIKFEKLLIFLMQNKWIGAYLGYPILLALNSVKLLKSEFEKIKLNVKMRKLAPWQRINLIFPLLVFAIRHADRGALSLITRGLNEEKFYYFEVDLKVIDKIIILMFCLIVLVCTAI